MKRAKLNITMEALSDLLRLSGIDIWINDGRQLADGIVQFDLIGSGLPDECVEGSNKLINLYLTSDVIEFDGNDVGAVVTAKDPAIDISKGFLVIPRRNAEIYGVLDNPEKV